MEFEVHATGTVRRPAAAVFAQLTDIERLPDWNREIREVHEVPAAMEPGAQWVVEVHAMGTHWPSRSQAIEVDPERGVFSYRSVTDDGNPSFADWRWELTPIDGGAATHVDVRLSANPRTFWRKHLLSNLRRPSVRRAIHRSLVALEQPLHDPVTTEEAT